MVDIAKLPRLEEALRNASAAGDTAAATQIAQEIRSRRATGDQQTALPAEAPAADPLGSIPLEISGVTLTPEIRKALLAGQKMTDPREKRLLAARIGGRIAAMSDEGNFIDDAARSDFGVALRSFGSGIFGIGDLAAAAGTFATGELSFGEALEAQREFRRSMEEERPVLTIASEVAGSFVGGGAVGLGIKALAKGKKSLEVLDKLTTFKKGERLKNIGKASLAGSIGGAITEGITEEKPLIGAGFGALGGPVGLGLAKSLGVTFDVLKGGVLRATQILPKQVSDFLNDPAAKGLKVLAQKMGVSEKEMSQRFLEFKTVTGKNPSIADIANPQAAAELRAIISSTAGGTAAAREAAERTLGTRAQEISEQVAGGRVVTTQTTQRAARTRVAERQFAEAEKDNITFTGNEVQNLLNDADLRRALPATLKSRLNAAQEGVPEGSPVTLSGLDVNDLRLALRDRARGATGADRVFGELANEVEGVARAQSPAFGRAIDEFAARSVRGEAVAAGRRGVTQPTTEFEAVVREAGGPVERAGLRVGARAEIADVAREGVNASARLARTLSEDSGLIQRLRSVLPEREVNRLQEIGRLQSRSIANIGRLAPEAKVNTDLQKAVSDAVNATVLASTSTSAASKVFAFGRLLKNLGTGLNDRVIDNLAKDAFDPKKTQKVISAMRRAEISEENILTLFASSVAGGIEAVQIGEEGSSHNGGSDHNTDHNISDR